MRRRITDRRKAKGGILGGLTALVFVLGLIGGYLANIYKLVDECDFQAPYKCEVVRVIGIPVAPVGAIAGYFSFDKEQD